MKAIPNYENYLITPEGKLYRKLKNGNIKEVKGRQNKNGYIQVTLSAKSGPVERLIHRLVAEAFLPNPENKPQVDHIDEDKINNQVNNLRWVTAKENISHYHTKDGRDHYIRLAKKRKEQLKTYAAELRKERQEINRLTKQLVKERDQHAATMDREHQKLLKLSQELEIEKSKFLKFKTEQEAKLARHESNYTGYKDVTGVKFGDVKTMVEATGKQITVQGQMFPSCGAAASWIVEQEAIVGNLRNKDTISKELRRYLQGRKSEWRMYGRYSIGG